jgi:hypothetical protein
MSEQRYAIDQFVEDYTLVTDNEFEAYSETMEMAKEHETVSALSDQMRDEFESYIAGVVERERELGHEIGALLISEMLMNWGSSAFDRIASHYLEKAAEL